MSTAKIIKKLQDDEPNSGTINSNINASIKDSKSFDHKSDLNDGVPVGAEIKKDLEIAIPLKHLGNFWRSLNMPLINFEISLDLSWNNKCILISKLQREANAGINPPIVEVDTPIDAAFKISDCKLYVPVVTLSTENENKLYEMLKYKMEQIYVICVKSS